MSPNRRPTARERGEFGQSIRKKVPRSSHGQWSAGPERSDPIGLIEDRSKHRAGLLAGIRQHRREDQSASKPEVMG